MKKFTTQQENLVSSLMYNSFYRKYEEINCSFRAIKHKNSFDVIGLACHLSNLGEWKPIDFFGTEGYFIDGKQVTPFDDSKAVYDIHNYYNICTTSTNPLGTSLIFERINYIISMGATFRDMGFWFNAYWSGRSCKDIVNEVWNRRNEAFMKKQKEAYLNGITVDDPVYTRIRDYGYN